MPLLGAPYKCEKCGKLVRSSVLCDCTWRTIDTMPEDGKQYLVRRADRMLKKHKELLKAAKDIFGNLVKCAYVYVEQYDNESKESIAKRLRYAKDNAVKVNANGTIDYSCSIVLEFNNGKKVMFNVNEDGWINAL